MQELAGLGGNVQFCKMEVQTEVYQQIFSEFVSHITQMRHTHTHTVHTSMKLCVCKHEKDKGDSTRGAAHTCLGTYLCTYSIHIQYTYTYTYTVYIRIQIQYTAYIYSIRIQIQYTVYIYSIRIQIQYTVYKYSIQYTYIQYTNTVYSIHIYTAYSIHMQYTVYIRLQCIPLHFGMLSFCPGGVWLPVGRSDEANWF